MSQGQTKQQIVSYSPWDQFGSWHSWSGCYQKQERNRVDDYQSRWRPREDSEGMSDSLTWKMRDAVATRIWREGLSRLRASSHDDCPEERAPLTFGWACQFCGICVECAKVPGMVYEYFEQIPKPSPKPSKCCVHRKQDMKMTSHSFCLQSLWTGGTAALPGTVPGTLVSETMEAPGSDDFGLL